MEPPPSIALSHEPEWICKESALVTWNDPDRSEISSLGLPCPNGKPTQITLWVGKYSTEEFCIMLQLRISARFSKRRKVLDYYLLLPRPAASISVMKVDDASQDVKGCLEDAYGKSSTKKCIRVLFQTSEAGRVLMPSAPENAPCFGGTPLHLLTQFRSLSRASKLDIYIGYSTYAQHALTNLESPHESFLVCADYVDLPRSYGGNRGVFDDWRQLGDELPNHFSEAQQPLLDLGQKDRENSQTGIGTSPRVESRRLVFAETHEAREPEDGCPAGVQAICSPPPYSPPRQSIQASVASDLLHASEPQYKPLSHLKRSRDSSSPENDQPCTKSAKPHLLIEPCSTVIDTASIVYDTQSPLARGVSYSSTVVNTPSTVEDPQLYHLGDSTPNRGEHNSSRMSPVHFSAPKHGSASYSRIRQNADTGEGRSATGHSLIIEPRHLAHSFSATSSSPETPCIRPTVFTKRHEVLSIPDDAKDAVLRLTQKRPLEISHSSFTSTQGSLDNVSPERSKHPINKALKALVAAQLPPLTTEALQRIMDDLLESVDYSHKVAETGLQETFDEFRTELQLEKDKGIEDINDHAEEILAGVKCQMEDLASGHLISFEDMLQQTNERLQQTLKVFLEGLIMAMAIGKEGVDRQKAENAKVDAPLVPDQTPVCEKPKSSSVLDSSAVAATNLFLQEFGDLETAAKVKVLERLTSQSTAEIFLTVDTELREAWVASWTGGITR